IFFLAVRSFISRSCSKPDCDLNFFLSSQWSYSVFSSFHFQICFSWLLFHFIPVNFFCSIVTYSSTLDYHIYFVIMFENRFIHFLCSCYIDSVYLLMLFFLLHWPCN